MRKIEDLQTQLDQQIKIQKAQKKGILKAANDNKDLLQQLDEQTKQIKTYKKEIKQYKETLQSNT